MKTGEAIREIMKAKGVTLSALADKIGKSTRLVSDRLRQENMSVDKLNELVRTMDYKIVLVPRERKVGQGEYRLE